MIAAALQALYGRPQLSIGPFSLWVHLRWPETADHSSNVLSVSACWDAERVQLWTADDATLDLDDLTAWADGLRSLQQGDAPSASLCIESGEVYFTVCRLESGAFAIASDFGRSDDWVNYHSSDVSNSAPLSSLEGLRLQAQALCDAYPVALGWKPRWGHNLTFTQHVAEQWGWDQEEVSGDES